MSSPLPQGPGPNDVQILLVGGPCNGMVQIHKIKAAAAGHLTCGGAIYVPDPRDTNFPPKAPYPSTERWVPNWQAAKEIGGAPAKASKNVGHAWSRLMHSFQHSGIRSIRGMRHAAGRMDRLTFKLRRHH